MENINPNQEPQGESNENMFGDVDQGSTLDAFYSDVAFEADLPFAVTNDSGDVIYDPTQNKGNQEPNETLQPEETGTQQPDVQEPINNEPENIDVTTLQSFFTKKVSEPSKADPIAELNAKIESIKQPQVQTPKDEHDVMQERLIELSEWMNEQLSQGATPESLKATISREVQHIRSKNNEKTELEKMRDELKTLKEQQNYPLAINQNMYSLLTEHKEWGDEETYTNAVFDKTNGAGELTNLLFENSVPDANTLPPAQRDIALSNWWYKTKATNPKLLKQLSVMAKAQYQHANWDKITKHFENIGYQRGLQQRQRPSGGNGSFVS